MPFAVEEDLEQLSARQAIPRTRKSACASSPTPSEPDRIAAAAATQRATERALVVGLSPGHAELLFETGSRATAELARELAETSQSSIAVGDHARVTELEVDTWRVVAVEPRRSQLVRCDPGHARRDRVVAANVDVGVVVCAARLPPLRPGLIDRYWAALTRGGIVTVVVVNKLDQLRNAGERAELDAQLAPYRELGLEILECCAHDGRGIQELRARLSARVGVLVGHSGVGKSSLLAALAPESAPRVGAMRPERETPGASGGRGAGRGRHTTTSSSLVELPGGGRLIDTPGIRVFGVADLTLEDLESSFPEVTGSAPGCRFSDCRHDREPDCAVRAGLESGTLDAGRFASYQRLRDELESRP